MLMAIGKTRTREFKLPFTYYVLLFRLCDAQKYKISSPKNTKKNLMHYGEARSLLFILHPHSSHPLNALPNFSKDL